MSSTRILISFVLRRIANGTTGGFTLTRHVFVIVGLEWSFMVITTPSVLTFNPFTTPFITDTTSELADSHSKYRSVASAGVKTSLVFRSSVAPYSISYSAGLTSKATSVVVFASTTVTTHDAFLSGSDLSATCIVAVPTFTPLTRCVVLSKLIAPSAFSTVQSTSTLEALAGSTNIAKMYSWSTPNVSVVGSSTMSVA